MNNYCTKCGKKLKKNDLICSECNTPVVDIPADFKVKNNSSTNALKVFGFIVICIFIVYGYFKISSYLEMKEVNKIYDKYAKPYLDKKYSDKNYKAEYESNGKCIIDGNCYISVSLGFGSTCKQYEYLDEKECKAYYYKVSRENESFILTVFHKDKKYNVIEGRNIYGLDNSSNNTINSINIPGLQNIKDLKDLDVFQNYNETYNFIYDYYTNMTPLGIDE